MINKKEIDNMRDLVSTTIRDLIFVTTDPVKMVICVNLSGKIIELPLVELNQVKYSAKDFINYLKEKIR